MEEAVIAPILSSILGNLTSLATRKFASAGGLASDLDHLKSRVSTVQAVLQYAEQNQLNSQVEDYLKRLKDAAYQAEDVLDEFFTQAKVVKVEKEMGVLHQVSVFSLRRHLIFRLKIGKRITEVRKQFEAIASDRQFHLNDINVPRSQIQGRPETTALLVESESDIYGRDKKKKHIVDVFCNYVERDPLVYTIYGMGGVGKTTLAQLILNDERIKSSFELKIWVCVSEDFTQPRLARAILESITGCASDVQELDALQKKLLQVMSGKRFLLVLDDVWNEDMDQWNALRRLLSCGGSGSILLVTTRMKKIAEDIGSVHTHHLQRLSEYDSWSLFKQRAFGQHRAEERYMRTIGWALLKKCCGVPLAIKALGSLMKTKNGEREWRSVLEKGVWGLETGESSVLSILKISYYHLEPLLRQCFAYCCVFPKNYEMGRDTLIQLWMANGFIPSTEPEPEELGAEIFNQLVSRSFIQDVQEHLDGTTCKIHDLMHDLASSVMKDELLKDHSSKEQLHITSTIHHMYLDSESYFGPENKMPTNFKSLRSLVILDCECDVDSNKLSKQKHLVVVVRPRYGGERRKLIISFSDLQNLRALEMPYFFGRAASLIKYSRLKHLRYLNLSHSYLKSLPKSIIYLQNLQTLILRASRHLHRLPKGMKYMKNLRFLDIRECPFLDITRGMAQLESLQILASRFVLKMGDDHCISDLGRRNLYGDLQLQHLEKTTESLLDAASSNLKMQKMLHSLSLSWDASSNITQNIDDVIDALQPHSRLKKLTIAGFPGSKLPHWLENNNHQLEALHIKDCYNLVSLPPAALQNLSSLKELHIEKCVNFRSLSEGVEHLTRLSKLEIWECPQLYSLPEELEKCVTLEKLWIRKCTRENSY